MECTDQVLAEREIHTDLAADGAINLREQCRGNVRERDPSEECGRSEPRGIADDSTSDGHDGAAAIGPGTNESVVDPRDGLQCLESLTVGDQDRIAAAERTRDPLAMKSPDKRIRDDEATTADVLRIEQRARAIDDAVADPDC